MADFRRCFYALALVALLAGLTVPASAQAFNCTQSTGVPPIVRGEGYAELMGDLIIDCTGGIPTPPNQTVPAVNIAVNLDVPVTSQVTKVINSVEFLESLLIVDEPNSGSNPTKPLLNCGRTAAPDNLQAGAGVCNITGAGALGARNTYDGTNNHPNVFQGRSFFLITGQFNQVLFAGVPIDPPGTLCAASDPGNTGTVTVQVPCHRIIRITNIRGDATSKQVSTTAQTTTITADLLINPSTGLPVDIPTHVVARVQLGLVGPALNAKKLDFIQCTTLQSQSQNLQFSFKEGFENAFKPQSLTQVLRNGTAKPSYNYTGGGTPPVQTTPDVTQGVLGNQNVPGATYDTESGFVNSLAATTGDNPLNPLTGGTSAGVPFSNSGGVDTGIILAGIATQGTRLMINFSNIPAGSTVTAPNVVLLTNVIAGGTTGVAVLINNTNPSGFGGTPASLSGSTTVAGVVGGVPTGNRAVYEVFFSNPNALEQLSVTLTVNGTPNLPSNLPEPGKTAQIQGNFAPFYDAADNIRRAAFAAPTENTVLNPATLAIPRFLRLAPAVDFFAISRCSCNLLFPFVTNAATVGGSYDTGLAVVNTSVDPGNSSAGLFGFKASAQAGPVQLWFFNKNASPAAEPDFGGGQLNTQCTNVVTPGSCTGALTNVPGGGMLTYILSSGGVIAGQLPAGPVLKGAPGFTGYVIAQTGFQYCHGFAFIQKAGAGFQNDQAFMGYLALVLDPGGLPRTSTTIGETLGH